MAGRAREHLSWPRPRRASGILLRLYVSRSTDYRTALMSRSQGTRGTIELAQVVADEASYVSACCRASRGARGDARALAGARASLRIREWHQGDRSLRDDRPREAELLDDGGPPRLRRDRIQMAEDPPTVSTSLGCARSYAPDSTASKASTSPPIASGSALASRPKCSSTRYAVRNSSISRSGSRPRLARHPSS
jgi:hypothetical protein